MTASIPLAWLGTYLVHSTILLGAVWAVSRWLRRRGPETASAVEERLWKTALVGGLITATLQVGLAFVPGPRLPLFSGLAATDAPAPAARPAGAAERFDEQAVAASAPRFAPAAGSHPILDSPAALLPGWQRLVLGVWTLGGLIGLGLLAGAWIRLRRTLHDRSEVSRGTARATLDRLVAASRSRRDARLTGSDRLPVPVALGVLEREICVPHRVLESFGPRRQEGLLAHELAHLERRDPAWLLAARVIESGLFVQPLNRLARARLQEIAEYRCDRWAVEHTGDRVGLARCLTEVAEWMTGVEPAPRLNPVPGMAGDRRTLGRRVRRILADAPKGTGEEPSGARRWGLGFAAAALLGIGCFAPGVAPAVPAEAATSMAAQESERAEAAEAAERAERAERAEAREAAERAERFELEGAGEADFEVEIEPEIDIELDSRIEMEIERVERMAEEIARRSMPDPAELEALEAELERVVEHSLAAQEEALAEIELHLSEKLEGIGNIDELPPEERARLEAELRRVSEEARRIAEQSRPNEEELDRIREQARRIAEESRPDPEEIERMNREVERMNREIERISREELRRVERELERNREVLERQIRKETREEVRRELEAAREELEAHRTEVEEVREHLEAEMSAAREERARELEEHRRELDEQRRELEEQRQELDERRRELEERHREERERLEQTEESPPPTTPRVGRL